jgi:hypothetical protein
MREAMAKQEGVQALLSPDHPRESGDPAQDSREALNTCDETNRA